MRRKDLRERGEKTQRKVSSMHDGKQERKGEKQTSDT